MSFTILARKLAATTLEHLKTPGLAKTTCADIKYHLQTNHIRNLILVADGANPNRSMYIRPGLDIELTCKLDQGFNSTLEKLVSQ